MQRQTDRLHPVEQDFVGRGEELKALGTLLEPDGPGVTHVYGIAGIGKSRLLAVFANRARAEGATIVRLDCRTMEPTTEGFLRELGEAVGRRIGDVEQACLRLGELGARVILVLDTYEVYRLMDTWLRQTLVPALPDNVRLLCLGRESPLAAWRTAPGRPVRALSLGALEDAEAARLLTRAGVPAKSAARVVHATHGHPLALQLAASAYAERPDLAFEELSLQQALEALTEMFLADVRDPATRRALEACSVVRRVTVSLLRALLPDLAPRDAYDRLRALPFVEPADDGLLIHDAVREAMARSLRARDPCAFLGYQKAAWQQLVEETRGTGRGELWRYTADRLYLIENPVVREAFFPSGTQSLAVEPATSDDGEAIVDIIQRWEGPEAAAYLQRWWRRRPDTFAVARGREGQVLGLCCKFVSDRVEPGWLRDDSVTDQWCQHLEAHPLPENQRALFCRRWLSVEKGEAPSSVQAALWLDLKRTYMELRPQLRRVYLTVQDLAAYAPVATRLGFEVLEDREQKLDGDSYHSAVLDFGPGSVDGWLAELAAGELGIEGESLLDTQARELVVDGERLSLTPLEFGVIKYLSDHESEAVSRTDLLRHVWDTRYYGGSNVVDTVVRSLRRKLGHYARRIETVTGVGYRFRSHR
ncbi:winged helix-turn-helix domain-containing protein [Marinobacter sp. SS13-12]|uniref:winged helix-turn-helix domain-containing protein n=1 Tax=Marinobacter sp. SS13-12 TaxID=3050451 RepID=UPI002554AE7A|nr:winged helix-turn-helix domain-containing protein [Marinobacter sp. SS13-12]MDK8462662.1 winged helix-turn-helix domain-containing protein [Marinobacter sp. SS13-12]